MAITADKLHKGMVLNVRNQGMNITPQTITVTVHWVGPDAVHYFVSDDPQMRSTSVARFLAIINQ